MNQQRSDDTPDDIDPARAAEILRRAAEIDAQLEEDVHVADLRAAAREAGIRPAAFERALAEAGFGLPQPRPNAPLGEMLRRIMIYKTAAAGLLTGTALSVSFP